MDRFDMDFENRIVTPEYTGADAETEFSLRPRTLAEYIGQDKAKENLSIYIEAAKMRGERRSTMCCSTALPDWARPPFPPSSPTR